MPLLALATPLPPMADELEVALHRAEALRAAGEVAAARDRLLAEWPALCLLPRYHLVLGELHRLLEQDVEAKAATCAAAALDAGLPLVLFNLGTAFFMAGQPEPAEKWYRLTLRLDPDLVVAHQNLSCILADAGQAAEAQLHRDLAYRRQCVFIEPAATPRRSVLILAAAGLGNVPIEHLMPNTINTRIKWFVEYGSAESPLYDVCFNAIADPDMEAPTRGNMARFLRGCTRPVLNPPETILPTRRDRIPALLGDIADVVVPPALRFEAAGLAAPRILAAMARAGIGLPILLRPAGSHGGKGLQRIDTAEALAAEDFAGAPAQYVTAFHDYRSPDGYWRKYRMIFVDRQPFAYHLAISPQWLVHYFSAEMLPEAWKRAEEARFLQDPEAVLGARAMAAIAAIGRRLDLDYGGLDFSLLPDGRVLVFEANATMLAHPETLPELAYKTPFVARIFAAFEAMLEAASRCTAASNTSRVNGSTR
jgi:tetratricopeptide (TPR) repeat protein